MGPGRRPTAYLHIGPHKTGSTSIQHFCRTNYERLVELGLYFPLLIGEHGRPARNHQDLGTRPEIRRNGDLKPGAMLWSEIDDIACKAGMDVLLSSEMFCNSFTVREMFPRILTFFEKRGYRVVVIAYVRDQPAWLNSKYVQSQKRMSRLISFEAFCAEAAESGGADPERYLRRFVDEPRCELQVVSFEQAAKAGLERDFIRRCGISDDATLEDVQLRNPNAGAKSVYAAQEIMRRAGPKLMSLNGFGPVYADFKQRCQRLGYDRTPYVALDQTAYERIRSQYAPTNERFARARFGRSWAELYPPRTYARSMFEPAKASKPELDELEDLIMTAVDRLALLADAKKAKRLRKAALAD
ncbi:hypothetical protein [Chenggangzhangella methanolivorans]|uniref:Sulfotransferase family protein n=1 Tax=Chenggangzhangella methanolivorans TaxID=1437009 RepID=A0A9E6R792_9HYPH|nr:hypothetical protein [Chenggangzhangella methanolivorans]QZN99278.1 hypothetical protein K6K41_21155 [Chenggangzhangella methanolivorans]